MRQVLYLSLYLLHWPASQQPLFLIHLPQGVHRLLAAGNPLFRRCTAIIDLP